MKTTEYKFPSPVGELCFSMFYPESGMVRCWWFPSPVGELCFSIVNSNNFIIQRRLSFPSPVGELCFSMKCITMDTITIHCFRPLSGSYVSQLNILIFIVGMKMFPSPVGELCFSIGQWYARIAFKGFRPLSGSYVSQSRSTCMC